MKSLFKGIKGIIILIFLIILFIIGYFVADGYKLYKSVIYETSIEDKVKEIQSNPSYIKLDNVSKYIQDLSSFKFKEFMCDICGLSHLATKEEIINEIKNRL